MDVGNTPATWEGYINLKGVDRNQLYYQEPFERSVSAVNNFFCHAKRLDVMVENYIGDLHMEGALYHHDLSARCLQESVEAAVAYGLPRLHPKYA